VMVIGAIFLIPSEPQLPPWPLFLFGMKLGDFFHYLGDSITPPEVKFLHHATGYWNSEIIKILIEFKFAENLVDGPCNCHQLVERIKQKEGGEIYEPFLCRFLEVGERLGYFQSTNGIYSVTSYGMLLIRLRDFPAMINNQTSYAWKSLSQSLRSGKSGTLERYGLEYWQMLEKDDQQSRAFDAAMESISSLSLPALIADYEWGSKCTHICDIAGGKGHIVAGIVEKFPNLRAVILDRPQVASSAKEFLAKKGVQDKVQFVGGDMFQPLNDPRMKLCDCFILKHIIHDWNDVASIQIMKNLAAVMKPTDHLLILEAVLNSRGKVSLEIFKKLLDINMMAANPSGAKERRLDEYTSLLEQSGLVVNQVFATRSVVDIIETSKK